MTAIRRKTSLIGLELIKYFETFQPRQYDCPSGKPTIGYGHVILPGEKFPPEITIETANELLARDLAPIERLLNNLTPPVGIRLTTKPPPFTQGQFDALASFIFNCGSENFLRSKLRYFTSTGQDVDAAAQFDRWVHGTINGKKTVLRGLVRRRTAERRLYETGEFNPND